jgi:hypothetical protein
VVSIEIDSCRGCPRAPWEGTDAVVPSIIVSSACWTPSPGTSPHERLALPAASELVDLIDVDNPGLRVLDVGVGGSDRGEQDAPNILADYDSPASVRVVASAIAEGRDLPRERLRQQRLAAPARPSSRMFGFRSSMSCSSDCTRL